MNTNTLFSLAAPKAILKVMGAVALTLGALYAFDAWKGAMKANAGTTEQRLEALKGAENISSVLTKKSPGGAGDVNFTQENVLGFYAFETPLQAASLAAGNALDGWATGNPLNWTQAGAVVETELDAFEELLQVDPHKAVTGWDDFRAELRSVGYESARIEAISKNVRTVAKAKFPMNPLD